VTIFVLLFLMLGSVVIPVKAVVLNVLSLSVSFGALVWVFQDGNLSNLLGFTPLGSIDGTQPILIFAIAFGLSMDYEVFLLSRVKEHYDRTGNNTASVALGVQKTGGIITSAAILLVVVIGGFATGQILFIKQIGVGLALAILVDATIVRVLLVPATMRLLGKYNWWAPAPLTALYKRMGMSEVEQEEESEKMEPVLVEMDRKAS
jgi:RND superfamily putative drug exporter